MSSITPLRVSGVTEAAVGGITAQNVIAGIRDESLTVDHAWLRYIEIVAKYGKHSIAARAYVVELAKRAAE